MRLYEAGDVDAAQVEKDRLEKNQRDRRNLVKELIMSDSRRTNKWSIDDERTFYEPQFFDKQYTSKGQL